MKKARPTNKKLNNHSSEESNPSDFHFELTRIAVSQICQSVGFKSTHLSSLQTLSRIAALYIKSVAETAASYSNRSNRTEANLVDLINALHDLSSPVGFAGVSAIHSSCVLSSRVVKDLSAFVKIKEEIPFAKPIPRPPALDSIAHSQRRPEAEDSVMPRWLPEFPEESAYRGSERRRRKWEVWEESEMVKGCRGIGKEKNEEKGNLVRDLKGKRERLSFKMNQLQR